jgi:hypothetical protein
LKLEQLGIKGEGLSFSKAEKTTADSNSITIGSTQHFVGNIGQRGGHSSIQATQTDNSILDLGAVRALVAQIIKHSNELPTESSAVVRLELKSLDEDVRSSVPNQSKIRAALSSIKTALEGAAGNLIASGILAEIAKLLTH